jgi:YfiH family protein
MVLGADCPLLLVADAAGGAVGAAHASWRGTVKRIAARLVEAMVSEFHVAPDELIACIGPSAGPCCYEIGPGVAETAVRGIGIHAREFIREEGERLFLDLWAANRGELIRAGVARENVHVAGVCTICHHETYPSYRAEGQSAGRFAAAVGLAAEA